MKDMFCYQCQEAAGGKGCTRRGVCGKEAPTSRLQDLLIYTIKGIALLNQKARSLNVNAEEIDCFILNNLFVTITNTNFYDEDILKRIEAGLHLRDKIRERIIKAKPGYKESRHDAACWLARGKEALLEKAATVGVLSTENEDIRSLRELLVYGLKGMAAYLVHADHLGYRDDAIIDFMEKALVATLEDSLTAEDLTGLVMECGKYGVEAMALLDKANTSIYGHPEITEVQLKPGDNPGILISGHDLKDLAGLLKQTKGTGVDVYTHGEMLPAHYYPAFKKYEHFAGNYGNAWWQQNREFASFKGPIIMTTNCLIPPKETYSNRLYTTGVTAYPGIKNIPVKETGEKDFSGVIQQARKCSPPESLEQGTITGGFAHNQVLALADKVIAAIKGGHIRRFFVMAGCDGRMKSRSYYTEFAEKLPSDTVILTAGCAKYRYNKLPLGDIGGIPRVLDAGQCNDSYSLVLIALKLKEAFGLEDINQLPISYNIAWYEQKAVIVLLALLYLGVKEIHLGPTLPAFLSPNVASILVEKFGLASIKDIDQDLNHFLQG